MHAAGALIIVALYYINYGITRVKLLEYQLKFPTTLLKQKSAEHNVPGLIRDLHPIII